MLHAETFLLLHSFYTCTCTCLISEWADQFIRYELKLTSPEVDLLWSKLPVEKDGTASFEEFVQYCFLNFNVPVPGGEEAGSGECTIGKTCGMRSTLRVHCYSLMFKVMSILNYIFTQTGII